MTPTTRSLTAYEARSIIMACESGTLLPEFTVYNVVIDLLAVDDDSLRGYEIKASTDRVNDSRVHAQLLAYSRVMERLTSVVAPKFLDHCEAELPLWVGVTSIEDDHLLPLREARPNPDVDVRFLAKMLWRPEAVRALQSMGVSCPRPGDYSARRYLCAEVAELMPEEELRRYVRKCITERKWSDATVKGKPRTVAVNPSLTPTTQGGTGV